LIVGERVTNKPNDKQELVPDVNTIPQNIRKVSTVIADSGFYSENAIMKLESEKNATCFISVEKMKHNKSVEDLEKHSDPPPLPENAPTKEKMKQRLKTKQGKEIYKQRKQTVEPVIGIIKQVMGFRQFLLRGIEKVNIEWTLVTLAYNFKRLFNILSKTINLNSIVKDISQYLSIPDNSTVFFTLQAA